MAANGSNEGYLERLTQAFLSLDAEKHVSTKEFADAVEAIMPIFDFLGEEICYAAWQVTVLSISSLAYTVPNTPL